MRLVQTEDLIKHLEILTNSPGAATGEIALEFLILIVKKIRDTWMWTGSNMIIESDKAYPKCKESRIK